MTGGGIPPREAMEEAAALLAGGEGGRGLVFCEESRSLTVTLEDGGVQSAAATTDRGAGLTLVHPGSELFASIGAPTPAELVREAAALARLRRTGGAARAASSRPPALAGDIPALSSLARLCETLDRAARKVSPAVVQVRVVCRHSSRSIAVARSDGHYAEDLQPGVYLSVLVTASKGGVVQTGYEALGGAGGMELAGEEGATGAAVAAARRAVALLDARKAPGGAMTVVLSSSAGGTMIHEAVGHGLEADLVLDGHSLYAGRIGQRIASPLITVVDDPTLSGRRGSYAVDDEGVPASRTLLVDGGVLRRWLNSLSTAGKTGAPPTGNGRRESFRHRPIPRMSNTFIAPGTDDPAKILRETPKGLFVTRMGGGQVDTVSGDFVFEVAEGFLIEGGEAGEPVRGATLTGNGPEVLLSIDRVGSDLGFSLGTCGKDGQGAPVADAQPTLRIPSLVVGGGGD